MAQDFNIKVGVTADVDQSKVQKELNQQTKNIDVDVNAKVKVDKTEAQKAIQKVFDKDKLDKQGREYFTKTTGIIKQVKDYYKKNGAVSIDITNQQKANGQIKSFTATVTEATGVIKKFNYERGKINTGGKKPNYGFVQTDNVNVLDKLSGTKLKQTDDFLSKIQTRISDINSKTFNQSKPLLSTENSDKYNTALNDTRNKINSISQSTKILSDDHKRDIGTMIADLDRYRKELQNVEYAGTKLKPDTFADSKAILQSQLGTNIQKWDSSNVFDGNFKKNVLDAKSLLDSATNPEGLDKYRTQLKLLSEDFKQITKTSNMDFSNFKIQEDFEKLKYSIGSFLKANPKTVAKMGDEFESLRNKVVQASKSADPTEYKKLSSEFGVLRKQAESFGNVGQTAFSKLSMNVKNLIGFMGSTTILFGSISIFKQMVEDVTELNSVMTDLRKVTNSSEAEYNSFLTTATDNAKQLGSSIKDIVSSTADFARLGYSLPDATELARVATLYSNVGDINVSDATTSIISTMKAFGYGAEKAEDIVSIFNEVGNRFAISSAGIGDSLQNSAAALMTANNTLEQSTALTVGANNVLQDPSAVGVLWKTVSMRIRSAKSELEDAGLETEGIIESTSKLQDKIKSLTGGFDIMLDEDTFKSTYDIIVGIGDVWSGLSDIKQAELLEILAGKRQGTGLASALTNVEDIKNAFDAASKSAGSAAIEQDKYEKSVQYSADRVRSSLEALSNNTLNSDWIKGFYDISNALVEIVDKVGLLKLGLGGLTAFAGIKKFGSIDISNIDKLVKLTRNLNAEETISELITRGVAEAEILATLSKKGYTEATIAEITAGKLSNVGKDAQITKNTLLSASFKELYVTMAPLLPAVLAIAGLGAVMFVAWYNSTDQVIKRNEKLRDGLLETNDELKAQASEMSDKANSLSELADQYKNAAVGSKEYYDIANQIAEISPTLVIGYTNEGNAILDNTEKIREQTEAYRELAKEKIKKASDNAVENISTFKDQYDDYASKKKDEESQYSEAKKKYDDAIKNKDILDADTYANTLENQQTMMDASLANALKYSQQMVDIEADMREGYVDLLPQIDESKMSTTETNVRSTLLSWATQAKVTGVEFTEMYNKVSDNSKVSSTIDDLFSLDLENLSPDEAKSQVDGLIKPIADYLNTDENTLKINLGFENVDTVSSDYNKVIRKAAKRASNLSESNSQTGNGDFGKYDEIYSKIDEFAKEYSINTIDEIDKFDEALTESKGDIDKAFELYLNKKSEDEAVSTEFDPASFSKITSGLSEVKGLYDEFYDSIHAEDSDGKFTPFDISALEKLRDTFPTATDAFNEFESVLTNSASTTDQVQSAFDNFSTSIIMKTGALDGLTTANRSQIVSQLELQDITNASAIVTDELAQASEYLASQGIVLSSITAQEAVAFMNEAGYSQESKFALAQYTLAKTTANGIVLSTDGDIANLKSLMTQVGASTTALDSYAKVKSSLGSDHYYTKKLKLQVESDIKKAIETTAVNTSTNFSNPSSGEGGSSDAKKELDIMQELNSEMDKYQSGLKAVQEVRETAEKYGKITVDQGQEILDTDLRLIAEYGNEADALDRLGKSKLTEMQIQYTRDAMKIAEGITTEAQATAYLAGANENLAGSALNATQAMLQQSLMAMKLRGTMQGQAADTIMQGYQNGMNLLGKVDFGFSIPETKKDDTKEEKEEEKFEKEFNWIDKILDKLSKTTEKFQKSADNFFSWWRKNQALDKAISSNKKEIGANEDSYAYYLKQANKVGLNKKYKDLVQNGSIRVDTVEDEELANKIEKYQEWYDKAIECRDAIDDLYNSEREMINQKYDNVIDYYSELGSTIQSVIDKVESLFSLKQAKGKRIDVNDLIEQFNGYSDTMTTITNESTGSSTVTAKNRNLSGEEVNDINGDIDSLNNSVYESATYKKLLADIAKIEAKQAKLQAKGKNLSKSQLATLEAYYNKKKTLEENSTSDTITQYAKTYDAFMKLQKRLDSGKSLSTSQRKSYNDLKAQLENFTNTKQETLKALQEKLDTNLSNTGTTADIDEVNKQKKAELEKSYQNQIADYNSEVTNTKQYKDLQALVDNLKAKKAKSKTGNLATKEQAKLDAYLAKIEALKTGGTAENISEYIKAYDRFQKLSSKKSLSAKEATEFDNLKSKLKSWNDAKTDKLKSIANELADAMERLNQDQTSSSAKTESEMADNEAKRYETAKAIAELQKSTLEDALEKIDAYLSSAEKNLELYKKFGVATLKEMGLVSENTTESQTDLIQSQYKKYLAQMEAKQKNLKDQTDVYIDLINAVESGDYSEIKDMYSGGVFAQYGDTFDKVIKMLEDNTFDGFSQTWLDEWYKSLQDVNGELISSYSSIQELYDTMREEVTFKSINDAIEQLDYLKTKLDSMGDLISDDILYNEDGTFSEQGMAKVALVIQQLENAKKTSLEYAEKYNKAMNDTTFANDDEKQTYLKDLEEQYRQGLLDTKSYTEELMSLYENQSTSEVDSLQDVIDKRKEALQAKKDYYDYDKNIKGQTKDIDALKAQIDALNGISDAESKSKKAQLEASLSEKEDALADTKNEHSYELQISALDDLVGTMNESKETQKKSLEYTKEIVDKMKLLTENVDVNSTMDKLEKFYLGLGTDILGNEVSGSVPTTTSNGTTTTPTTSIGTNVSLTSSIDSKLSELISATKNGITLTNGDTLLKSMDANFTDFYKNMINPIYNMDTNIGKIPSMISSVQPNVTVQIDHIAEFTGNVNDFDKGRLSKLIKDSSVNIKMDIVSEMNKSGIWRKY